jgi:hypothetical protein
VFIEMLTQHGCGVDVDLAANVHNGRLTASLAADG